MANTLRIKIALTQSLIATVTDAAKLLNSHPMQNDLATVNGTVLEIDANDADLLISLATGISSLELRRLKGLLTDALNKSLKRRKSPFAIKAIRTAIKSLEFAHPNPVHEGSTAGAKTHATRIALEPSAPRFRLLTSEN